MAPHEDVIEHNELRDKLTKLGEFLDGPVFRTLSANERRLLAEQYRHMTLYRITLAERIRIFEGK